MNIFDTLLAIGQMALGLAGFSSILIALSGSPNSWLPLDSYRITGMLVVSFMTLLLSLLPAVMMNVGVSPDLSWRCSAGIAAVLLTTGAMWSRLRYRGLSAVDRASLIPLLATSVQAGMALLGLANAATAVGLLSPAEGTYVLALFYSIGVACFMIFRFLFARPVRD